MTRSRFPIAVVIALAIACGSRTALDTSAGVPGVGSILPDGAVVSAPLCPHWSATNAPVQVSSIASIVELQAALPTSSGVLVGFADEQFPPVDSSWHARLVSFGAGNLGTDQIVLSRNSSSLGWTRVSLASGANGIAAAASDQDDGLLFVKTDGNGAPSGSPTKTSGDLARFLSATSTGYSVLRSPYDASGTDNGPVSLTTLDANGNATATRALLPASPAIDGYSRYAFADDSFLLAWRSTGSCSTCSAVDVQHFTETGGAVGPATIIHEFASTDAEEFAIAASGTGFLFVHATQTSTSASLIAEPFDANGNSLGSEHSFAEIADGDVPPFAIGAAPGGDWIAAWLDDVYRTPSKVYVQSVNANGTSEGSVTTLASTSAGSDANIMVVASPLGAMVLYESDIPNYGIEVYGIPLKCE